VVTHSKTKAHTRAFASALFADARVVVISAHVRPYLRWD
jgi:hypothetical protein